MSVDLELWFSVPRKLSSVEVKRAGVKMLVAMGSNGLWTTPPRDGWSGTQALEIRTADWRGLAWRSHETLVRCRTRQPYYGPGYERGNLVAILGLARFIRSIWSDATVFYGGDNNPDAVRQLTPEFEAGLWAHFTSDKGRDYYTERSSVFSNVPVRCRHCDIDAICSMGSGEVDAGYYCPACDQHWVRSYDGTLTETAIYYQGPRAPDPGEMVSLPRKRLRAIAAQLDDAEADHRHALADLVMLLDEVDRNENG